MTLPNDFSTDLGFDPEDDFQPEAFGLTQEEVAAYEQRSATRRAFAATFIAQAGLSDELAAMRLSSDQALFAALYPSLAPVEQQRLQQLNQAAGERNLTAAETSEQAALLAGYHRSVLRRAQALAILAERGHHPPQSPRHL